MTHKEHKEFTASVFRQLCDDARKSLPDIDANAAWETKAEIVLDHLKKKVIDFCGVEVGFGFEDVSGFPRYVQLLSEVVDIVDFDMVHQHGPFRFFRKGPIAMQYVVDAIGERP
ncbi:MAG TPA: hypothetical protein VF543_19210 [Pyrinomonadaceae bacterium]|jgi:hypothetical protein